MHFSSCVIDELVLEIRCCQSSSVDIPFMRFVSICPKATWDGLAPYWRKTVESVMNMSKLCQSVVQRDVAKFKGMSFTGGSWPKSPTRLIEPLPNGAFQWRGNASLRWSSMRERIFGPMKFISSMRMYSTWQSYSCNCRSGWPSRGCIVWIRIRSAEWIVRAFILKATMPIGARNNKGFLSDGEFSTNAWCKHLIKWDFPVPSVPFMMILCGVLAKGF